MIADGIVAIEGNGPLRGTPRRLGTIVLADDSVAADATCERLMGFEPDRIVHIREGSRFLGNASPAQVDQVGEVVNAPATPFQLVPEFRYLHAKGSIGEIKLARDLRPTTRGGLAAFRSNAKGRAFVQSKCDR